MPERISVEHKNEFERLLEELEAQGVVVKIHGWEYMDVLRTIQYRLTGNDLTANQMFNCSIGQAMLLAYHVGKHAAKEQVNG